MHQDKERIIKLLGNGLNGEIVSSVVGCDPSYISELMSDDEFRQRVLVLRIENLTADTARDKEIDTIEDTLIRKLKDSMEYLITAKDILRAYAIVNAAKRRGAKVSDTTVINNNIVNLILPRIVVQRYVVSKTNEVIELEGKPLVTNPATNLLAERKQRESAKAAEAATTESRILPEATAATG